MDAEGRIIMDGERRGVRIQDLLISDEEVFRILSDIPKERLPDRVRSALKVGVIALRDAETVSKVDFVEQSFQQMRLGLERVLGEYLGGGGELRRSLDDVFGDKGKLKAELERHLGEKGSHLFRALNPTDEESILGRFRKQMESLIDPNREGGPFGDLKRTLQGEFKELHAKLEARRAAEEEREKSSRKGVPFEEFVYRQIAAVSIPFDDRVEHVGSEPGPLGKQGDVLITLNPQHAGGREVRLVFEVKNRTLSLRGKNSIFEEVEMARKNRGAASAVVVVRAKDSPPELGSFRIDPRGAIICAVEEDGDLLPLEVAYKVARAEAIRGASEGDGLLDTREVLTALEKIRSKMDAIKGMKAGLSGAEKSLRQVKEDLDGLRDGVREILERVISSWSAAA